MTVGGAIRVMEKLWVAASLATVDFCFGCLRGDLLGFTAAYRELGGSEIVVLCRRNAGYGRTNVLSGSLGAHPLVAAPELPVFCTGAFIGGAH